MLYEDWDVINEDNMKEIEGNLTAEGITFGIIVARFNSFITERLLEGSVDCIKRHGGSEDSIEVIRVPGAFEIPLAAQKMAKTNRTSFDRVHIG